MLKCKYRNNKIREKIMIKEQDKLFILETNNTSYIFTVDELGLLQHLYYGAKINLSGDARSALVQKCPNPNGCSTALCKESPMLPMDNTALEFSTRGKGDMREAFAELELADGSRTSDFRYWQHTIRTEKISPKGLPASYLEESARSIAPAANPDATAKSLVIKCKDNNSSAVLELVYTVFEECDCMVRSSRIINSGEEDIIVRRLMSLQLDLEWERAKVTSFHGDWAREMRAEEMCFAGGKYVIESCTGFSSNRQNPFFMVSEPMAGEYNGEVFGFNLVYSGGHKEVIEMTSHGKTHIITGMRPEDNCFLLKAGEEVYAPEAVMTYSDNGYEGISMAMHKFVREHIVRGEWKKKERPVLLNSWEALYFHVNEAKISKLASAAADIGIELLVLDDGWFKGRNDDTSSLGDWTADTKKLPNGLKGIAKKVKQRGLMFGIWVEPEMANENSDLYRAHPEWAVRIPEKAHAEGRNQMLLDLSNSEVVEYLIESMSNVFEQSAADYVKWDMNRNFTDLYSQTLPKERQGEFLYRYMQGLYRLMGTLVKKFPHILFEGCASGGNRFDLGILSYFPQIWASDDSDAIARIGIQNGYSYGYPQSVIGAHVSGCPNHQTLRTTPLATRYAVASFGVLGYETNISDASKEELAEMKAQIALYKQWRKTLQFGRWYRLGGSVLERNLTYHKSFDKDLVKWMAVSENGEQAVAVTVQGQVTPHFGNHVLKTRGLKNNALYQFTNIPVKHDLHRFGELINMIAPIHIKQDSMLHDAIAKFVKMDGAKEDVTVSGSLLNSAGMHLAQTFAGTGYNPGTDLYQDYDAAIYYMEEIK